MANDEYLARLRHGVKGWNEWRHENVFIAPDLRGANLSRADLFKANLSGANLSGATLREAADGFVETIRGDCLDRREDE